MPGAPIPVPFCCVAPEYPTVLELVGATPIVRLQKLGALVQPTLLAKLEYLKPGGSVKDRIGLPMIEAAAREGKLKPGGTIVEPTSGNTGVGRYFKERKPEVLIVGVDPEGSVYTATDVQDDHPYLVEGIGKDAWPQTMDGSVVDEWVGVSDRDSFLTARRLAREEGLLVGGSGGTTVFAALEVARRFGPEARILTLIPDTGRNYLSKFYDDKWMLEHGFVERAAPTPTVEQVLRSKRFEETDLPDLVTIASHQKVGEAIDVMQRYSISQLPVVRDGEVASLADVIGSLHDRDVLERVFRNPDSLHEDVVAAMQPPLAAVDAGDSFDEAFTTLTGGTNAIVVARGGRPIGVLTRSDLLEYLAHRR